MAEQETQERDHAASATEEGGSTGQESGGQDTQRSGSSGADAEQGTEQESDEKSDQKSDQKSDEKSGQESEQKADDTSEQKADDTSGEKTEQTPARRSQNHAKPEQPSDSDREAQERGRSTSGRGGDDEGGGRSVDVAELVWKGANVLATVVRAVTLLFAAVLVIQIGLSIAAVNPANGFARFVRGFSDAVVLGFRDLFLPADPTVMLIVNFGVAAVFWVLVGVFVASGLRWVAARIS